MTALTDGLSSDDAAAAGIGTAFGASCSPAPTTTTEPASSSGFVNATTGSPVTNGGNLLVMFGGPYGQPVVKYLETAKIAPLYVTYAGNRRYVYERASSGGSDHALVDVDASVLTATHDYFLMEFVIEPVSRTPTLIIYGFGAGGTDAGSWFFTNRVLPDPSKFGNAYYVYEWTDSDGTAGPSAGDGFSQIK